MDSLFYDKIYNILMGGKARLFGDLEKLSTFKDVGFTSSDVEKAFNAVLLEEKYTINMKKLQTLQAKMLLSPMPGIHHWHTKDCKM